MNTEQHTEEHYSHHDMLNDVGAKNIKKNPSAKLSHDFHLHPKTFHHRMQEIGYERVKGGSSATRSHNGSLEHQSHVYTDGFHSVKVTHHTAAMGYAGGGYQGSTIEHVEHSTQHTEEQFGEKPYHPELHKVLTEYGYKRTHASNKTGQSAYYHPTHDYHMVFTHPTGSWEHHILKKATEPGGSHVGSGSGASDLATQLIRFHGLPKSQHSEHLAKFDKGATQYTEGQATQEPAHDYLRFNEQAPLGPPIQQIKK